MGADFRIRAKRSPTSGILAAAIFAFPAVASAQHGRRTAPPDRGERRHWAEPTIETRQRTIVEPAVFETRIERVWVEPQYADREVRVVVPVVYEDRTRRVWHEPVIEYRTPPGAGRRGVAICIAPQPVVVRPGYWETVSECVRVRPEQIRCETRRVCIREGYWKNVERRVCVKPECKRIEFEPVCVRPGRWEPATMRPTHRGVSFSLSIGSSERR